MARDTGRHAEARIGVNVGGADETLRQLVNDVIIFCEELTGDVKRNGVRAMFGDCG